MANIKFVTFMGPRRIVHYAETLALKGLALLLVINHLLTREVQSRPVSDSAYIRQESAGSGNTIAGENSVEATYSCILANSNGLFVHFSRMDYSLTYRTGTEEYIVYNT